MKHMSTRERATIKLLDRLAARGIVQRGVGKPGNAPRVRLRRPRRLLSDIVAADRR